MKYDRFLFLAPRRGQRWGEKRKIAAMPAELIERGSDAIRKAPENLREAAKGVLDMLLR